MRSIVVVACCLGLGACAPVDGDVVEPGLATWVPDESREDERALPTVTETTAAIPSPPSIGVREVDEGGEDVGCLLEPSNPACGPASSGEIIRDVVRGHLASIRACWSKVEGREVVPLGLRFTIVSDGSVTDIQLREGLPSEVDACLRRAIGAMQFPPTGGGRVIVSYPWR